MEQFVKQFSLIDFLGITLPGAILVLAANYYIWDITAPCLRFFGANAAVLSAYFVVLSYLCGCALHQLGIWLEYIFPNEKNVFESLPQKKAVQESYERQFNATFPSDAAAQIQAGRQIFRYVQRKERPQRIVIFSAFYTMSRTLLVTFPLLFVITFFCGVRRSVLLLYAAAWIICLTRWAAFDQCCIREAYTIFAAESCTQKHSDS